MQVDQISWSGKSGWAQSPGSSDDADLVLVFSDNVFFQTEACYTQLRGMFPRAIIAGCSSSGSVMGVEISDGDMVATIVKLEHSRVRLASVDIEPGKDFRELGMTMMNELNAPDLRHVFVLSDGLQVN